MNKREMFFLFVGLILGICIFGYWVIRNIAYADHLIIEDVIHQKMMVIK